MWYFANEALMPENVRHHIDFLARDQQSLHRFIYLTSYFKKAHNYNLINEFHVFSLQN